MDKYYIEKMFEDYLKDFLSKIGYKNLDFCKTHDDGENILFSQKEIILKQEIKRCLLTEPISFYEILRSIFHIFTKYFIFNIGTGIDLYEYFHITGQITESQYLKDDLFCLAQKFYKISERNIVEPKFIIMNNIVADGNFLEENN